MNIIKQLYLRLFKGYWLMNKQDMTLIKVWFMYHDKGPEIIDLKNGYFLISNPKQRNSHDVSI